MKLFLTLNFGSKSALVITKLTSDSLIPCIIASSPRVAYSVTTKKPYLTTWNNQRCFCSVRLEGWVKRVWQICHEPTDSQLQPFLPGKLYLKHAWAAIIQSARVSAKIQVFCLGLCPKA